MWNDFLQIMNDHPYAVGVIIFSLWLSFQSYLGEPKKQTKALERIADALENMSKAKN